jgi:hypothetical protein
LYDVVLRSIATTFYAQQLFGNGVTLTASVGSTFTWRLYESENYGSLCKFYVNGTHISTSNAAGLPIDLIAIGTLPVYENSWNGMIAEVVVIRGAGNATIRDHLMSKYGLSPLLVVGEDPRPGRQPVWELPGIPKPTPE